MPTNNLSLTLGPSKEEKEEEEEEKQGGGVDRERKDKVSSPGERKMGNRGDRKMEG